MSLVSAIADWMTSLRMRHRGGLHSARSLPGRPAVVCLVQNGASYIDSFIHHYRSLGCGAIVFVDNGSTDDTIKKALSYPDVTVFTCTLPFETYQLSIKRWLVSLVSHGEWCISVDIDEYLEYPRMDTVPLAGFLQYLSASGANAVTAVLIDCFADVPLSTLAKLPEKDPRLLCRYCDTHAIDAVPMRPEDGRGLVSFANGIRRTVFGTENICLTKHPLVRMTGDIQLYTQNEHFVERAIIADVTCVLRHYKFLPDFPAYVADAVQREQHYNHSEEYRKYAAVLADRKDLCLMSDTARLCAGPDALEAEGLVRVSHAYRAFADTYAASGSSTSSGSD